MSSIDVITYSGEINNDGYESICNILLNRKSEKALLVLSTPGGDPHAGFRIARALQHHYSSFEALIPRYCKSAGTLLVVGASALHMDDMSELGPLDVQVRKADEINGRNSGLDILQAVSFLQNHAMLAFRNNLVDLTQTGLSTRAASDICTKLTTGLFEPIFAQIDPMKLAEMQRATEIAFAYGQRLNEKSNNLRAEGLTRLVTGYPSHSFVIDRKEARNIFLTVHQPVGVMADLSKALRAQMEKNTYSRSPEVKLLSIADANQGVQHEDSSNARNGAGSSQAGSTEVTGDQQADPKTFDSAAPVASTESSKQ